MTKAEKAWQEVFDRAKQDQKLADEYEIDKSKIAIKNLRNEWRATIKKITDKNFDPEEIYQKLPDVKKISDFAADIIRSQRVSDELAYFSYEPKVIGVGANGVVLAKHVGLPKGFPYEHTKLTRVCYKFSPNNENEFDVLKSIRDAKADRPRYSPKLLENLCIRGTGVLGIAMDGFQDGLPFQFWIHVKDMSKDQELVNDIGIDVISGLWEMHNSGVVYHRDINPRNILIQNAGLILRGMGEERAKFHVMTGQIIDYEFATRDINKYLRDGNRRFNGPSDFSSLAQSLYYAVAGNSMFSNREPKDEYLSDIVEHIDDVRRKAYENPKGPEMKKAQQRIDENITNRKLKTMIKSLLVATHNDYEKTYEKFGEK